MSVAILKPFPQNSRLSGSFAHAGSATSAVVGPVVVVGAVSTTGTKITSKSEQINISEPRKKYFLLVRFVDEEKESQ
jgi:hypothetical protein